MAKFLEKGTKVKMNEEPVVGLAAMFGSFEMGEVGEIVEAKPEVEKERTWYIVKFEHGVDVVPESWFTVVKEEAKPVKGGNAKDEPKDESDEDIEGVELKIIFNGDELEIISDKAMCELTEKEGNVLYNLVASLYSMLGLDVND